MSDETGWRLDTHSKIILKSSKIWFLLPRRITILQICGESNNWNGLSYMIKKQKRINACKMDEGADDKRLSR